ncbi:unnamed protein product [Chilo suppressalis]|uniref:Uncharacterized protein n=1 Tax=Chilo suppressalis TaxID=168631 RepID=A0ABN8B108_CHISP|nr:unnamed protein product [Chilo suppressalis]
MLQLSCTWTIYAQIIKEGLKRYGSVIAQNSHLGWFISGKVEEKHTETREVVLMNSQLVTDKIIRRFWKSEELHPKNRKKTARETECEEISKRTHSRTDSGCYIKYNGTRLGVSKSLAVKRLLQTEQRHQRNEDLHKRYRGFMDDYEELQDMKKDSFKKRKKNHQATC